MKDTEKATLTRIAQLARSEADKLATAGVGAGVIQVGGAIALRKFAVQLETEAAHDRGVKCIVCKRTFTDAEFQAEEVQFTPRGPMHADCYHKKLVEAVNDIPLPPAA